MLREELLEKVKHYMPEAQVPQVIQACDLSQQAHEYQMRESGEPYYHHPLEVACIMAEMKMDHATIITALLHDTVEDTDVTLAQIEQKFGVEISKLVDGVTKLTKIESQSESLRQAENFRKLLLAMSEDIRVLLVKLADRVHNMRTLNFVKSADKRRRIAHETMEIYAPLAERMGIQTIKSELQDLAFKELYSEIRVSIINRLEYLRNQGNVVVSKIVQFISKLLQDEEIDAKVIGREKAPYSIWQKMERKNLGFEQLSDIMAFRILVNTISECYHVLGAIHSNFHMVPDSFKDFISTPKNNGYQSIHTVVIGPERQRIEVQIRTHDMHEVAELGLAAHWCYKQDHQYNIDGKQYRWVRELLNILEKTADLEEFLENTKMEMYYDQVFCFSPKGSIIALPKGATPVDFAYSVHSNVGNTCVGAKINGRIMPLRTQLKNGDQVEIIRSKTQVPSPAWENFVVTGKARSEIKRFIRTQKKQEYINLGRAILTKCMKAEDLELNEITLKPVLDIFKKKCIEELLMNVGEGIVNRNEIMKILLPQKSKMSALKDRFAFLSFNNKKKQNIEVNQAVQIKGLIPDMAIHLASCCHPLPGDNIVGIVHSGKGINIHTADCEMLENFATSPERWIDIAWEKEYGNSMHISKIKVILLHEAGSLAVLSSTIAKDNSNITNFRIINRTNDYFEIMIDVEVQSLKHLTNLIASLSAKSCIHLVERTKF